MATMFALLCTLIFSLSSLGDALSSNYYDKTCPNAEVIVTNAVKKAIMNDHTVPAALLQMHFHECFIRGCDASVLLRSVGKNTAEKDGPPNISLHAFYFIDQAKLCVQCRYLSRTTEHNTLTSMGRRSCHLNKCMVATHQMLPSHHYAFLIMFLNYPL